MRKLRCAAFAAAAVLVLSAFLVSCGADEDEIKAQVQQSFDAAMEAFKSGDVDSIKQYCDSVAVNDDTELRSVILSSLGNIEYSVNSITVNSGTSVTVNADITLIDASKVMQKYVENIAAMVSSSEYQSKLDTMTKEDYDKLMDDELSKVLSGGEIPNVTKTVSVQMKKEGDSWKVDGSDLPDLLVTNTLNAIKQIKQ